MRSISAAQILIEINAGFHAGNLNSLKLKSSLEMRFAAACFVTFVGAFERGVKPAREYLSGELRVFPQETGIFFFRLLLFWV